MPERVTTGSEPRPVAFTRCLFDGPGQWLPLLSSADVSYYRELVDWEVVEVVESGHDEQTEPRLCEKHRLSSSLKEMIECPDCELQPWQPDPRTVAAVVEALRATEFGPGTNPMFSNGFLYALRIVERFSPSPGQEPGGTDGQ